ncbi:MAG: hypothetical protein J6U54_05895 [Clostridiales bacterium]|nr:hypothetical protein [Clostridiales bacterium]
MRKITVFCDKCGCNLTLERYYQAIDLGRSKSYELCTKCYDEIEDKIVAVRDAIFEEEAGNEK